MDSTNWDREVSAPGFLPASAEYDAVTSGAGIQYESFSNSGSWLLSLENRSYEIDVAGADSAEDSLELRFGGRKYYMVDSNFQPFFGGGFRVGPGPELNSAGSTFDYDFLLGLDVEGGVSYFMKEGFYAQAHLGWEYAMFNTDVGGLDVKDSVNGVIGQFGIGWTF